jgi:hypothetical protein
VDGAVLGHATEALSYFDDADASSEPGCSPDQKQPCPETTALIKFTKESDRQQRARHLKATLFAEELAGSAA